MSSRESSERRLSRSRKLCAGMLLLFALVANKQPVAAQEPPKIPPPQDITLVTKDGVTLVATYYPSYVGKDAVPVVLLHPANGARVDLAKLAYRLQSEGHALFAPDLRGHGDSARRGARAGNLRVDDYEAMVESDMEAVKGFLVERNNEGELNIDKLCIVGLQLGAVVAINWAALDWSWPVLATGKQGQDVKALVLISPSWSVQGLRVQDALAEPSVRTNLSVLIVAGRRNNQALQDANRLNSAFERFHPTTAGMLEDEKTLILRTPETNLQGLRLLTEPSLHVDDMISRFITNRLAKQPVAWSVRKKPVP